MKKGITVAVCFFSAVIIVLNVFHEAIGSFVAETIYKDSISEYRVSDSVETQKLKKNDYIYFGKYNGQNILWKVISVSDDGTPMLLSEKVICFMPFHSANELKAGSSNWETSTIRQWLNSSDNKKFVFKCSTDNKIKNNTITINGGFLCLNNFTADEISVIEDNEDKVFLPTRKMLSKIPTNNRKKSPTPQAVINDGSKYIQFRAYCWYWTKSPISTNTSSITTVTSSGGFYKSISNDGLTGVCPALKLKNASVTVCGGNGTVETPYVFASEVTE